MAEHDDDHHETDHHQCEAMTPTRRRTLGMAGAMFAASFVPRMAYAAPGSRDARLLVVILRGALDGLSVVAPLGDPDYAGLRPGIALTSDGDRPALPLDGFFALHPAMPHLARLYRQNEALILHAVATGYRARSHFDGQDVLESGQPGPGLIASGWLNRMIAALPKGEAVARAGALGVGVVPPLIVRGAAPVLGWAPPILPRADNDLVQRLMDLYGQTDPVLAQALSRGIETETIASRAGMGGARNQGRAGLDTADGMKQVAAGAARLLAADDGPRVAALAFEGWDTHANEGGATGRLATLLGGLDGALATFEDILKPRWKDATILIVTEFGRTARVNGTVGTDHGTGTVAFLAGGAVKGGRVMADWPGLKPAQLFEQRDLNPTIDLRAVCKGVIGDLFGVSGAMMAEQVFPGTFDIAPINGLIG